MRLFAILTRRYIVFTMFIAAIGLFQSCGPAYHARKSVSDASKSAHRLLKKPDDKRILDFNAKYTLAQAEMQRMLNEAQNNPLVYGTIADNALEWMNLSNLLKSLEATQVRGDRHVLVVEAIDYTSIVADARQRASDAYFYEGVKIIQLSSDFQQRKRALAHFGRSMKYSQRHADDIDYYESLIYIEEADRLMRSAAPSLERLSLAREYYDRAMLLSAGNHAQQQMIQNKIETIDGIYINVLINTADRLAMTGDRLSVERAIDDYYRAVDMGSREADIKLQDLLRRVGIVVVIGGERISPRFLDHFQRRLPNYVRVDTHYSPFGNQRYEGDILIIPHRDWGKRDQAGNIDLSFEIIDLRRPNYYKLMDFPYKAKRKESFETILEWNQDKVVDLIRKLGLNTPYLNRRIP